MRLERLQLLVEAADRGSISAVARARGCTASAISQQLSALEAEAGVRLLERSNAGVSLTPPAGRIAERVRRAVEELRAAEWELRSAASADVPAGEVAIASVASASATIVSAAVKELRTDAPGIKPRVEDLEPVDSLRGVKLGDWDLAVFDEYEHVPGEPVAGLVTQRLLTEPLVLVLPATFQAPPGPLPLSDFADHPWVLAPPRAACGDAVRRACYAAGFSPSVRWSTDDLDLSVRHVASGHGVAVLPWLATRHAGASVVLRAISGPPLTRHIHVATRAGASGGAVLDITIEKLVEAASAAVRELEAPGQT